MVTTKLKNYSPVKAWEEAGIYLWGDADNWVKFDRTYTGKQQQLNCAGPQNGVYSYQARGYTKENIWLRIVKVSNTITLLFSENGEDFEVFATSTSFSVKKAGIFAANNTCADFDFFWIKPQYKNQFLISLEKPMNKAVVNTKYPELTWKRNFLTTQINWADYKKWNDVNIYTEYHLLYSTDKDLQNPKIITGILDNEYIFTQPLANRTYYWQVSLASPTTVEELNSPIFSFTVKNGDKDLTAPVITDLSPWTTTNSKPVISAYFKDNTGGTGIDTSKVKLELANINVTDQAIITETGITYTPTEALLKKSYKINLKVSDKNGNTTEKEWFFTCTEKVANTVQINDKNVLLVNGQPFLPNGFYGVYPGKITEAKALGINFVTHWGFGDEKLTNEQNLKNEFKYLDEAHANGIYVMAKIPRNVMFNCNYELIAQWAAKLMAHPAFLCWWFDEPECHEGDIVTYNRAYQFLKKIDPHHPVGSTIWWPLAYKPYATCTDFYFPDAYPFYNFPSYLNQRDPEQKHKEHPISFVGDLIRQSIKAVNGEKPVWYIAEEFGPHLRADGKKRYPTREESRCMYYSALVNGANGFMPYIWRGLIDRYKKVLSIKEINYLAPIILHGSSDDLPETNPAYKLLESRMFEYKKKKYLIVVNADTKKKNPVFSFDTNLVSVNVLFEDRAIEVNKNSFTDEFTSYDVHVYEITEHSGNQSDFVSTQTSEKKESDQNPPNLISNPGFEKSDESNKNALGWKFNNWNKTPELSISIDDEVYHGGEVAVKLESKSKGRGVVIQDPTSAKKIEVIAGEKYNLSLWCKSDNLSGYQGGFACVFIMFGPTHKREIFNLEMQGTKNWVERTKEITIPSGNTYVYFYLQMYNSSGKLWFDDISFTRSEKN